MGTSCFLLRSIQPWTNITVIMVLYGHLYICCRKVELIFGWALFFFFFLRMLVRDNPRQPGKMLWWWIIGIYDSLKNVGSQSIPFRPYLLGGTTGLRPDLTRCMIVPWIPACRPLTKITYSALSLAVYAISCLCISWAQSQNALSHAQLKWRKSKNKLCRML